MRYFFSAILLATAPVQPSQIKLRVLEEKIDSSQLYACWMVEDVFTCMTVKHYNKALAEAEAADKKRIDL